MIQTAEFKHFIRNVDKVKWVKFDFEAVCGGEFASGIAVFEANRGVCKREES